MVDTFPILGLIVGVSGIVIGILYKFYRDSKKDNINSGFNKGKIDTTIELLKEEIHYTHKKLQDIEEDIEKGHMDYDSIQKQIANIRERLQKQIADIRERLARIEG